MPTRRKFLQSTAAATAMMSLPSVHASGNETLKLGLIGCGGRGTASVLDAFAADSQTRLIAVCDLFPEIARSAAERLAQRGKERVEIGERIFHGFEGYKQLIDSGVDVVLMAAPPGFRPRHLDYAVKAKKHVFAEKPLAVDAPGVRSVLESAKLAKENKLLCASGFCYRHHVPKIETIKRIHDGAIGDVVCMQVSYNTGMLWHRGDQPSWSAMEKQIRNWLYYTWLSGDHLVEQAIHNVDKACWVMGEYPVAATGLGGRQMRTDPKWGNVWDHFSIVYEYANGRRVFAQCRQMANCKGDVSDHVWGTQGRAELMEHIIVGPKAWSFGTDDDVKKHDMYVNEHRNFFRSIRAGQPFNDMESAAMSTLMAILGRQAAYTGQRITWKQMQNSQESLVPEEFAWGDHPVRPVAIPGVTKFT